MPRIANETSALLADLKHRIEALVAAAAKEGHDQALEEVRSLVGVGMPMKRGPGRPKGSKNKPKTGAKRKSWWDTATEAQKAERKRAMLAGRGLNPNS